VSEYRNRHAVGAVFLFSVVVLFAVSYAVGPFALGPEAKAALLWLVFFFASSVGLTHAFVREEDSGTAATLRAVAAPASVFAGKLAYNIALVYALEIVVVPLFLIFLQPPMDDFSRFVGVLIAGGAGLACGSTIVAAIISRASGRGALFAVLAFPILLPVLVAAISGTRIAFTGGADGWGTILFLGSFSVMTVALSAMLFPFVWSDT
jgi:heme exporter protein B